MTFEKIIDDLKQRKFAPVYFLMGEEPYYIDKISDYIGQHALKEEEKAFNQTVLYGKDVDAAAIINHAKRFPMMAEYHVVIVREAQNVKDIENLIYYITSPSGSTILVINYKYKSLDKRKKFTKEINSHALVFESKRLYDHQVPDWIMNYLKGKGCTIQPTAALLLTEFLGNDLQKIEMELEKLRVTLPPDTKNISTQHIEENIGISKDYNTIELQKALVSHNALKAYRIVEYFGNNQRNNPINLTIASLYFFFNKVFLVSVSKDTSKQNIASNLKINPFFVSDYQQAARIYPPAKTVQILHWLREYDMKSKGVGNVSSTPHDLLKELIARILTLEPN